MSSFGWAESKNRARHTKPGTIVEVGLKDFMCHGDIKLFPSPFVNVVTGANGSGKSSVLQAIVLALGGKGADTKRCGSNTTAFVRHGQAKAHIRVVLNNRGGDAFKPELYGDEIIFERTIKRIDGGKHSVRSEKNTCIYEGRAASEERRRILVFFNIDPTDPFAVLQQEEAKKFFAVNSRKDLYDYFERGTQLRHIKIHYEQGMTDNKVTLEELKSQEMRIENLKEEELKWNEKWKSIDEFNRLSGKSKEYRKLLTFHRVEKEKKEMEGKGMELQKIRSKHNVDDKDFERIKVRRNDLKEQRDKVIGEKDELDNAAIKLQEIQKEMKKELAEFEAKSNNTKTAINTGRAAQDEIKEQLEKINEELAKLSASESHDGRKEELQEKKAKIELRKQTTMEKLKRSETGRNEMDREVCDIERRRKETVEAQTSKENERRAIERRIRSAESQRESPLHLFGRDTEELVRRVSTTPAFAKQPIGPIGAYIKLQGAAAADSNLSLVVEAALDRKFLRSWIADSQADARQLRSIIGNMKMAVIPTIIVSGFRSKRYDLSSGRVPRSGSGQQPAALIDLVVIDNVQVHNVVVDWKSPESTLVGSSEQVQSLFSRPAAVPTNAKRAFTTNFYRFLPAPTYSSYYVTKPDSQGRLLINNQQEHIDQMHIESAKLLVEINKLEEQTFDVELRKAQRQRQEFVETCKKSQKEISDLRSLHGQVTQDLSRVGDGDDAKSVHDLEAKKERLMKNAVNLQQNIEDSKKVELELEKMKDEQQRKVNRKFFEIDNLDTKIAEKTSAESKFSRELVALEAEVASVGKSRFTMVEQIRRLETEYQSAKDQYERRLSSAQAEFPGPAPTVDKSAEELIALIKETARSKKEDPKDPEMTVEEIFDKKEETERERLKLEEAVRKCQEHVQKLQKMGKKRNRDYRTIRRRLERNFMRVFSMTLSKNEQVFGRLDFDHEQKLLRVGVSRKADVDMNERKPEIIPMESLSGGEKAKSLCCLIMSFWENLDVPFRALDEWDVHADDRAREEIGKMMITFAVKSAKVTGTQCFFISPQNVTTMDEDKMGLVNLITLTK